MSMSTNIKTYKVISKVRAMVVVAVEVVVDVCNSIFHHQSTQWNKK
jgi:hypothetical protein